MKPWQIAKEWVVRQKGEPFEAMVGAFLRDGLVVSNDQEFLLAREVSVVDGEVVQARNAPPNAWLVQLAAGRNPFRRFLGLAPRKREFVVWQRRGDARWHVWRWERFNKRVGGKKYGID